ncbi:hypothetical protein, partial [Providencia huashanensis]|uniref:hypothetical protein n=1 Tax=Providencia huashanensis TaxID=3037798 RepID=UPI002AFDDE50
RKGALTLGLPIILCIILSIILSLILSISSVIGRIIHKIIGKPNVSAPFLRAVLASKYHLITVDFYL